jgi:hypothetical protein
LVRFLFSIVLAALSIALTEPSIAADVVPQVPNDDIFGFTTPTDIGKAGDTNFANENDGRLGKRGGRYDALDSKLEFSRTLSGDWWIAGSLFAAHNHAQNVPGLINVDGFAFDGLSFEIEHRILSRSPNNPFAASISIEPRWGRIDPVSGRLSNSLGAAFKLFVDAVVLPDKLFWAGNLIWTPQTAQVPANRDRWMGTSATLASTALTFQISNQLFAGAEARYLSAYDGVLPTHNLGNAFYLGPTVLWRVTDKISFNTTLQPQIFGRSKMNPGQNLDLDNFERAQFRAKLAVTF